MDALELEIADAVKIAVPANLRTVTTYVLLEQERWFEKEIDFLRHWLRPGMTAIDIGANLGVYSLPMARLVGPSGRVFAYEPGSEARALLQRSQALNGLDNLRVSPLALSNAVRDGRLVFGSSSELNALGEGGAGETVRITSLDVEDAAQGWRKPDFIKIDAEGEEARILDGGRGFFHRHSPLVMFEIKAGETVNEHLRALFPALGYRLFRQLGGAPVLVPDDAHQALDGFELNLFAAKPDRVANLARQGLLVETISSWAATDGDRRKAEALWRAQSFAPLVAGPGAIQDAAYRDSLAGYAAWLDQQRPLAVRCAALHAALQGLRAACARAPTVGRLSTLARVGWEWGARGESVATLQRLLQAARGTPLRLDEPFWPASARFDGQVPSDHPTNWFIGAAAEQFVTACGFSSVFVGATPVLAWLCGQPFARSEMERRRTLLAARAGQRPRVPDRLRTASPDHLNATVWRAGLVPGTVL